MFIVEKYKGKWAVLDTKTCVWNFIGAGKKYCEKRAKELNEMMREEYQKEKYKKIMAK